ncbi:hypothetical protein CMI42_05830 [Candidatus Pacearchaeota archaeon]|nr:hypothetical protein [Candidatus Pacearchaeota archaeon]
MSEQKLSTQMLDAEKIGKILEDHKIHMENLAQEMIDGEMALLELKLKLLSVGEDEIKKARADTESFKIEWWEKARQLSINNGTTRLDEYKKLIDFI